MKVLVLGADGMLGHQVVGSLVARGHDVTAATRRVPNSLVETALAGAKLINGIDARIDDTIVHALGVSRPDAVVNAIGIVKQRPEAKEALESIRINGLLPHQLAAQCEAIGARLVHISTDCVFSGKRGNYSEADLPDPVDLYGRTKLIGEVGGKNCITLRTSIIGLELFQKSGLVEWFLRQEESAMGWSHALYSGITTMELSRVMINVLERESSLDGVWHVSAKPISKLDLLARLRDLLGRRVDLVPDDSVTIDRTMDSTRFMAATSYVPPSWDVMLEELAGKIQTRESHIHA